mmetsp:Transcript_25608/g.31065  ORF Transcript_25608/g.31065 Transcript_25608/m.31065 type:complete len:164 (-) Transcript_25608:660-1151(-)
MVWQLLKDKGEDIFRMKGVLAIAHAKERFVYQAVHMQFNGQFDSPWADSDDARESKLVFIGRNLDHEVIKADFVACLSTPELQEEKKKSLRFAVGDKVKCYTGDGWENGEVVALMYREDCFDPGVVVPYQIQLDNGLLIFAPADDDQCIRSAKRSQIRLPWEK